MGAVRMRMEQFNATRSRQCVDDFFDMRSQGGQDGLAENEERPSRSVLWVPRTMGAVVGQEFVARGWAQNVHYVG